MKLMLSIMATSQNSFLGVSWDIILPVLISTSASLIIFLLGNYFNRRREKAKKRAERELVKDTIVTWAENNGNNLCRFLESVQRIAKIIGTADQYGLQQFNIQHLTLDVLTQFKIDRLTDSLYLGLKAEKEEKSKMLNDFLTSVSYLIRINDYVQKTYDDYTSRLQSYSEEWNHNWNVCNYDIGINLTRVATASTNQFERNFYLGLSDILDKTTTSHPGINPPLSAYEKMILECKNFIRTFVESTPATFETEQKLSAANLSLLKIQMMKNYSVLFDGVAKDIENTINHFLASADYYRNKKVI